MSDNILSSGEAYTHILLAKWEEIMVLGEEFREKILIDEGDLKVTYAYVSKLTRLWGELRPKLKNRTDLKELVAEFETFSQYYYDPKQLSNPEKSEDIFKLEAVLRDALEKLKITTFEGER